MGALYLEAATTRARGEHALRRVEAADEHERETASCSYKQVFIELAKECLRPKLWVDKARRDLRPRNDTFSHEKIHQSTIMAFEQLRRLRPDAGNTQTMSANPPCRDSVVEISLPVVQLLHVL